ncbi:MAG: hypothetical protein IJW92_08535 [Clostridia bacterium]|nr:hypothetical protein [Clostridia bacterium]
MKFTQHYTVKWHDTDVNRRVRPAQLLMYMQETAGAHFSHEAMSLDEMRDTKGLAFLLSSISICIYDALYAYDEIDVQTWVCEGRGLSYNRCFCILRNGQVVAEAASVWALLDLNTHRLLKAEEEPFHIEPENNLQLVTLPKRLRVPALEHMELAGERQIVYSDIDYNGHMNNTHYPDLFCDYTPDICGKSVTGMMFSFLHEASYGHVLKVYRMETEDGYLFRTVDENGTVCTDAFLRTEPFTGLEKRE